MTCIAGRWAHVSISLFPISRSVHGHRYPETNECLLTSNHCLPAIIDMIILLPQPADVQTKPTSIEDTYTPLTGIGMSKMWALVLLSMPTAATANGGGSEEWFCPPLRLIGIYNLGCRCPFSTGSLARIGELCDFEGVFNCCFVFYISCLIFSPICVSQSRSSGVYRTSQETRDGFERSMYPSFFSYLSCYVNHTIWSV